MDSAEKGVTAMDYWQFVNEMEEKVQRQVAENAKVEVHITVKNNGTERRGLMITQKGINISPTIYLEEYYTQFLNGKSLEQIAEKVMELYREVRFKNSWEGSHIQSFPQMKQQIVWKLISRERNQQLLKETPYEPFLDMAVVCYALLELNKHGTATMLVKNEHLKMWGVEKKDVFQAAERNSRRIFPAEFRAMKEIIAEMSGAETGQEVRDDCLYVLSNQAKNFGAVCIAYEGVQEMIAEELGENYYVIPSSVHEMLILPESKAPQRFEIEKMVTEINRTQVEKEEVLSDKVYYYSKKEKRLI